MKIKRKIRKSCVCGRNEKDEGKQGQRGIDRRKKKQEGTILVVKAQFFFFVKMAKCETEHSEKQWASYAKRDPGMVKKYGR